MWIAGRAVKAAVTELTPGRSSGEPRIRLLQQPPAGTARRGNAGHRRRITLAWISHTGRV